MCRSFWCMRHTSPPLSLVAKPRNSGDRAVPPSQTAVGHRRPERSSRIRNFGSIAAMLAVALLAVGVAWAFETRVAMWVVSDTAGRAVTRSKTSCSPASALDIVAAIAADATRVQGIADPPAGRSAGPASGMPLIGTVAPVSSRCVSTDDDGAVLYADQAELRGQKVLPSRAPRTCRGARRHAEYALPCAHGPRMMVDLSGRFTVRCSISIRPVDGRRPDHRRGGGVHQPDAALYRRDHDVGVRLLAPPS